MAEVDGEALAAIRERLRGGVRRAGAGTGAARPGLRRTDAGRRQYGSIPVLETLVRRFPEDALKLLAVTERDLFIPVLTFVYGHAQLGGRAAMISLARLRQEFHGLPGIRACWFSGPLRKRCTKPATHSGWCTARTVVAPCRFRPTSGVDRFETGGVLRGVRGALAEARSRSAVRSGRDLNKGDTFCYLPPRRRDAGFWKGTCLCALRWLCARPREEGETKYVRGAPVWNLGRSAEGAESAESRMRFGFLCVSAPRR